MPISPLIPKTFPDFIKTDYSRFYNLLVNYFNSLEESGEAFNILDSFLYNSEPNNETETFIDKVLLELGFNVGQEITIPKSQLILHLRDFYLSRGSKKSFDFLFRLFFNSEVSISYPREELLVTSWANYSNRHFIFTTNKFNVKAFEYAGQKTVTVMGLSSKDECSVEQILVKYSGNTPYLRIQIDSNQRRFTSRESVVIKVPELGIEQIEDIVPFSKLEILQEGNGYSVGDRITISNCALNGQYYVADIKEGGITDIIINNGGTGYSVGDLIKATRTKRGHSFSAQVNKVSNTGAIEHIEILSPGYDYETPPQLYILSSGSGSILTANNNNIGQLKSVIMYEPFLGHVDESIVSIHSSGSGASFKINRGSIFTEPASQKTFEGSLGNKCILHDSFYFQQFSYQVRSKIPRTYSDFLVDSFIHPAGWVRFNMYVTEEDSLNLSGFTYKSYFSKIKKIELENAGSLIGDTENQTLVMWRGDNTVVSFNPKTNLHYFKGSDNFDYIVEDFENESISSINNNNNSSFNYALDAEIEII